MNKENLTNHFNKVLTHKKEVFKACCKVGIPIQGIMHDMSKFSPVEFFESAKYYCGDRSPIDKCKEVNGYSLAWFHHRGRNKHHWEYWVDNFDKGMTPVQMPFKYALEMLCDFIGAGKAYHGKDFTYQKEWGWWLGKRDTAVMHPVIWEFINEMMKDLVNHGEEVLTKRNCKRKYIMAEAKHLNNIVK